MAPVKIISILLFAFASLQANANNSDTLVVIFDKQKLAHGDSIEIEVYTEPFRQNPPAQTLHLWIENVKTGKRWKYRYPFLKSRYSFTLKVNDSIPNGTYAFNFLLQKKFLAVNGKLKNEEDDDKEVNYIATTKNKAPIIDGAQLEEDRSFKIDNIFYTDTVCFTFSPAKRNKTHRLKISIATPRDSAFIPEAMQTEFAPVGMDKIQNAQIQAETDGYIFSTVNKKDKELLEEIVLKTKAKSKREKFENENVSGLFASDNSRTIDFYENDELKNYPDIYSYLTANVAGITSFNDEQTGRTVLYWRNQNVNIYVDEFLDVNFSPVSLIVQDIELVKIYSPGSRMLDGFNGAVAIYTRRMSTRPGNKISNYSFYVRGYTPKNTTWK